MKMMVIVNDDDDDGDDVEKDGEVNEKVECKPFLSSPSFTISLSFIKKYCQLVLITHARFSKLVVCNIVIVVLEEKVLLLITCLHVYFLHIHVF